MIKLGNLVLVLIDSCVSHYWHHLEEAGRKDDKCYQEQLQ